MDNIETTDEHIGRNERGPLSKNSQLTRKMLKKVNQKEWKIQNAASKRNADKQKLSQVSSSDTLIDNPIEEGPQLLNGCAVRNNNDELSTTSSTYVVKKPLHSCNNNGNRCDISTTSELKPDQPELTDQSSTQSYNSHGKDVCSTKKPHVDYNFPSNDEYECNLRDSASTAHNLERKDHNKSSILGTNSNIDICSAQAAESSASTIDSTCKKLSMTDKLYKCLFDVAKPVLCERLSRVMDGETIKNLGKYLLKNVHYFYHQKSNASNLTCQCTITGNQFCETLKRIKYHNKNDNLTESVFFNFYTKTNNGRCKECKNVKLLLNRKECLCVYGPKVKEIDYLDFNDLEFLILECDPCISEDDKLAVSKLVFVRNDIVCHRNRPRTDRELNEVWEDTKQNILSLCSSFLYKIFKVNIDEIEGMTTVTKKEFEDLQKQIATFNLHFNSEQERLNRSIQDSEQAIKDHISSEFKGANDNSNRNTDEILGEMREGFGKVDALLSFFKIKQDEQAQGNKPKVEVNFKSSSMMNEEKAVNVLSQNDDSDSNGFQIESIERKCLLLVLKASPDIFKNETTLRIAIRSLIVKIIKAGDIDTGIPSTINVEVKFNGQFKNDEEDVIRRMLSLSIKEKNKETALQGCQKEDSFAFASTSDDTATTTDYSETLEHLDLRFRKLAVDWSSSSDNVDTDKINASKYQGPIHLTEIPCQSCEEKDKQIQAYETKIKQHQNITEKKELQETSDGIPPGTIEPLSKPFCQCCEDKEKRIKSIKKQHQKEWQECQYNLDMLRLQKENSKLKLNVEGLQTKNSELKHITRGLKEENSKLKGLQEENSKLKHDVKDLKEEIIGMKGTGSVIPCRDDTDVPSRTGQLRMSLVSGPALHSYHTGPVIVRREDTDVPSRTGQLGMSLLSQQAYHAYAGNSYPKAKGQKGLAVIVYSNRGFAAAVTNLQVFFEEMGFVVQCIDEKNYYLPYRQVRDGNFYCVFLVLVGPVEIDCTNIIRRILRKPGQPLIVMTDSSLSPSIFSEITEETDTLMVMPSSPFTGGSHQKPDFKPAEHNILDYFMKVTRSNRFTDIMDILTRMNKLYYYPVITFKSSLRKKFSFL